VSTRMLCYKAWLDTQARFVIGLLVLSSMACFVVFTFLRLPGRQQTLYFVHYIRDAWFSGVSPQLWCLFAILLGSGGLVAQAQRGGALFALALPVSRVRLILTRVGVVLVELYLLALLPSLSVTVWAWAAGQRYASPDVFVVASCLFVGGALFFAIPFFLSSLFEQFWIPLVAMLSTAVVITTARQLNPELAHFTLAPLLTARDFLNGGSIPWTGLLDSAVISVALIALAVRNIARRDF
jgi:ABC-type transport system involved in multi-copper enzyme maturation permease subunit